MPTPMTATKGLLPRWIRNTLRGSTILFLLSSIFLSLFILLFPNEKYGYSIFSIQPINQDRAMVAQLPAPIPSSTIYPSPFSPFATPSAPHGDKNGIASTSIVTTSDGPARATLKVSRRKRQVADKADIVLPSSSIGGKNGSKGVNGTLGGVNVKEGEGVYLWLGKEGPSFFIGTMRESSILLSCGSSEVEPS